MGNSRLLISKNINANYPNLFDFYYFFLQKNQNINRKDKLIFEFRKGNNLLNSRAAAHDISA